MAAQHTHVTHSDFCCDGACSFAQDSDDTHLLVETKKIEIRQDNAVAISHTWGEFDRKDRYVGHRQDGTPVYLNLGEVWNVPQDIVRLFELSMDDKAYWIDQLSIPQDNEEIRAALADIPTIYRTLDVVVLMARHPCVCLGYCLDFLKAMDLEVPIFQDGVVDERRLGKSDNFLEQMSRRMFRCMNSTSFNPWFDRL